MLSAETEHIELEISMKVPEFLKVNRNPDPPRCHHTSDEGSPCNAPPQTGKKYCFFHDPRQQKKREAAHRNGGFMRNRRSQNEDAPLLPPNPPLVSFKTFDDVGQFFEQVTNYVLQGQMDARTAGGGLWDRPASKFGNMADLARKMR